MKIREEIALIQKRAMIILDQIMDPFGPINLEDFLYYKNLGAFYAWYTNHEERQSEFVDPLRYFIFLEHRQFLIDYVRDVRKRAKSWREFNVGAFALAHSRYNGYFPPFWGFNVKENPEDKTDCAEKRLILSAEEAGFDRIIVLAVSGPLQKDEISGRESPTLHPCWRCRELFQESPIMHPKTLIFTVHPEFDIFELRTVEQLINFHEVK